MWNNTDRLCPIDQLLLVWNHYINRKPNRLSNMIELFWQTLSAFQISNLAKYPFFKLQTVAVLSYVKNKYRFVSPYLLVGWKHSLHWHWIYFHIPPPFLNFCCIYFVFYFNNKNLLLCKGKDSTVTNAKVYTTNFMVVVDVISTAFSES